MEPEIPNVEVIGLVPVIETVGSIGSATASNITSAGVFPVAGIVAPDAYLPNVLPPVSDTDISLGKTYWGAASAAIVIVPLDADEIVTPLPAER